MLQDALQFKILAKTHPLKNVGCLTTGQIATRFFKVKQGRTTINDIYVAELIDDVFDDKRPFLSQMMHFVQKEMRVAMFVKILDQIPKFVPCKP